MGLVSFEGRRAEEKEKKKKKKIWNLGLLGTEGPLKRGSSVWPLYFLNYLQT